ncbi:dTDP-4-dehydrorhamnose reductase [Planobacterium oryzisoli]|uniref:dTDP-4-dehydrorhamnose reductase n=1 Tax=Planobacterium oryzisoli TaxID=2771435 RepID=A0A930YWV0_9FLAO|nr:dTDP-4-dehydrorhamnose reductase [Planobacterium oryzisoli]MBF5027897.1 dTDP-4-dehydrorhamnose reductase [Planobacterium oryzisoli]
MLVNNPVILVVGAKGQLAQCIEKISEYYLERYEFRFVSSEEMDVREESSVKDSFERHKPAYCINTSAYTAVDLAESEPEDAFAVNADGPRNLAVVCSEFNCTLIHVSTDYVFDGDTRIAYDEDNFTSPQSVYGASKLQGEQWALEQWDKTIVVRTSWLYSEFGKNFVKTMLHLFTNKKEIQVVSDQYGQPTYAVDLAQVLMDIISCERKTYGVFHYSNFGETTWFDFATQIKKLSGSKIVIHPVDSSVFPTVAKRPLRSTLSLDKIEKCYGVQSPYWENSLEQCLHALEELEL